MSHKISGGMKGVSESRRGGHWHADTASVGRAAKWNPHFSRMVRQKYDIRTQQYYGINGSASPLGRAKHAGDGGPFPRWGGGEGGAGGNTDCRHDNDQRNNHQQPASSIRDGVHQGRGTRLTATPLHPAPGGGDGCGMRCLCCTALHRRLRCTCMLPLPLRSAEQCRK